MESACTEPTIIVLCRLNNVQYRPLNGAHVKKHVSFGPNTKQIPLFGARRGKGKDDSEGRAPLGAACN